MPVRTRAGNPADVAVIGGGVIGHGIAWEASRSGRSVVLIDDAPGSGASWAAAGMLAPVSELHYQEEDLLELMLESSRLWPGFAGWTSPRGSVPEPDRDRIPHDADPRRGRRRRRPAGARMDLRAVQQASGLTVEPLTVREARRREPLLSPAISCAFDIPADHQVDPRRLLARLASTAGARHQLQFRRAMFAVAAGRPAVGGRRRRPVCSLAGGGMVRAPAKRGGQRAGGGITAGCRPG